MALDRTSRCAFRAKYTHTHTCRDNMQFVSRDRPHNDVPKYVDLNNGQSKCDSMCVSIACVPHAISAKINPLLTSVTYRFSLCCVSASYSIALHTKREKGSGFGCEGERETEKKRANNKYFCNKFFNLVLLIGE